MISLRSAKKIALALVMAAACATTVTSASAQGQYDRQNRWNRTHMSRYAFALGYSRGYDDAAQGNYKTYRQIQRWREGTEGWEDPMGTRTAFRDNFRRGFARGFMDARSGRQRRYSQNDVDRIRQDVNDNDHGRPDRRP